MKKIIISVYIVLLILAAAPAFSVHNTGSGLDCSGCHVMHATDGLGTGQTANGKLLSESTTEALCLSCHDTGGSRYATYQTTVPAIMNAVGTPPAGDFANLTAGDAAATANGGNGHNLGAGALTLAPAGGNNSIVGFTCTDCHDAHGVGTDSATISAYRNLLTKPDPLEASATANINATGTSTLTGDVYNLTTNVYGTASTERSHLSEFCAACHDGFYGSANTGASSPYNRHPTDVVAGTNWGSVNFPLEYNASGANKDGVFCITCHYPHAGFPDSGLTADSLRWDYKAKVQTTTDSGCEQCHQK